MWKWDSLEEFFVKLNEIKYVILRNYETLEKDIDMGGDIDILCSDKTYAVEQIHAYKRVSGDEVFNYFIMVGDKKIPVDVREVGDGYYDEKWEKAMLEERVKTMEYYVMDHENYKYSLLYHALLHKFEIKGIYIKRLEDMFGTKIGNNDKTYKLLGDYMRKKGYSIPVPVDRGVEFNKRNYKKICKIIGVREVE